MEKVFSPLPNLAPPSLTPPPKKKYAIVIVRKSDAKHNRHQKGASPVVPGDQAPTPPPPSALPTAQGELEIVTISVKSVISEFQLAEVINTTSLLKFQFDIAHYALILRWYLSFQIDDTLFQIDDTLF